MIFLILFLLIVMEVSLSFDNAVLNASILQNMSPKWQNRFITWGMPVAIFGMRGLFPILIIAIASNIPMLAVAVMAFNDPIQYAQHLQESHITIAAFGGAFLLMVFLEFICDSTKEIHWIGPLERKLSSLGLLKGIEIFIVGTSLAILQNFLLDPNDKLTFLLSGLSGLGLYVVIQSVSGVLDTEKGSNRGVMSFLYLEVLDASCSFDGVIGAFVLTNNILLITVGLSIGAFVIRSLTLYLVRGGVLKEYIYLEHGAHYGIGALGIIMITDVFVNVPEPATGLIGISFIGLSLLSSISHRKKIA